MCQWILVYCIKFVLLQSRESFFQMFNVFKGNVYVLFRPRSIEFGSASKLYKNYFLDLESDKINENPLASSAVKLLRYG